MTRPTAKELAEQRRLRGRLTDHADHLRTAEARHDEEAADARHPTVRVWAADHRAADQAAAIVAALSRVHARHGRDEEAVHHAAIASQLRRLAARIRRARAGEQPDPLDEID